MVSLPHLNLYPKISSAFDLHRSESLSNTTPPSGNVVTLKIATVEKSTITPLICAIWVFNWYECTNRVNLSSFTFIFASITHNKYYHKFVFSRLALFFIMSCYNQCGMSGNMAALTRVRGAMDPKNILLLLRLRRWWFFPFSRYNYLPPFSLSRVCSYDLWLCCSTCAIYLGMAWVIMSSFSQHIFI